MTTASMTLTLQGTPHSRALYELPEQGTSLTEWVARRLHKTELLADLARFLPQATPAALAHLGLYAAAASASFGPARYQPRWDAPGRAVSLRDPVTNALTHVVFEGNDPHLRFRYDITLPNGDRLSGHEEITGTTIGLRGLGMPAPSRFQFTSADGAYQAEALGVITSELAPRLGVWRIRAYGSLKLRDASGNRGEVTLDRQGAVQSSVQSAAGGNVRFSLQLA